MGHGQAPLLAIATILGLMGDGLLRQSLGDLPSP